MEFPFAKWLSSAPSCKGMGPTQLAGYETLTLFIYWSKLFEDIFVAAVVRNGADMSSATIKAQSRQMYKPISTI